MVNGQKNLQELISHRKKGNNGQLNPSSANPDTLWFSNIAKSWGVKYDIPRKMLINLYCQTDQSALNGNRNLTKKEGCGEKV